MASDKYTISAIIKVFDEATGPLKKVGAGLGGLGAQMGRAGEKMNQWGNTLSTRVTLPLVGFATLAVRAFDQSEKAIAGVRQGLLSTGNAAGKTVDELVKMSADMQKKTLFGDDEILAGATAQLLTFTNIAGKEFDRTQQAALDVATKLSMTSGGTKDLTGTAIMLGKALNDPVGNLGALSRSGIQFSDDQKKVIKTLWETGKRAEAQRVILAELEKQYGGTAEAAAKAGLGPMQQFMNQLDDTMEVIGGKLLPILVKLTEKLKSVLDWFNGLDESTKDFLITTVMIVAALGPVLKVMGSLISIIKAARAVTLLFNAALWANPLTWLVAGLAAVSYAIYKLIFDFEAVLGAAKSFWNFIRENDRSIKMGPSGGAKGGRTKQADLGLDMDPIAKRVLSRESRTDINLTVTAENGAGVSVDNINKKSGNSNVKLDTRTGRLKVGMKTLGVEG